MQLLVDYLRAMLSSQQRRRRLLLEHNLLHRLAAAIANALQLMGQGAGLAEAINETLLSILLLCHETHDLIAHPQEAAAGVAAAGAWCFAWVRVG